MTDQLECPLLGEHARRFQESGRRFEDLVAGLTPRQAGWKPAPRVWSVAECIEHLDLSARLYLEPVEAAIRRLRSRGRTGHAPYGRGTLAGRMILWVLDPNRPKQKNANAPGVFRPTTEPEFERLCDDYRAHRGRLVSLIAEADGLDLGSITIATPVSRLIRVTLAQAFEIHSLHEPRHLAQAERVTRTEGFPVS